jgi:hypothetical protein
MPQLQTFIVETIPEAYQGRAWQSPSSAPLRPNATAEEFPALVAEGLTGPIHVSNISSYSSRNGPDGLPMLWRVVLCCVSEPAP